MLERDEKTVGQLWQMPRTNRDRWAYIKVIVLLMFHKGYSVEEIGDSLGINDGAGYRYRPGYKTQRLNEYLKTHYVAYEDQLDCKKKKEKLTEALKMTLYINSKEISAYISPHYGLRYTCSGVMKLLKQLNLFKKTQSVPSKANQADQEDFVEELDELLAQPEADQVLYFNDAVHPQHNTKLDSGWIFQVAEFAIPTNPGCKRLNLYNPLNARFFPEYRPILGSADRPTHTQISGYRSIN